MTDLDKLEALAKAAARVRRDANGRLDEGDAHRLWHEFLDAANPATILDLIASARRDAEEIERLRAALKPFVAMADNMEGDEPDDLTIWESPEAMGLTFGDLRRARAAHTGEG